MTRYLIAFRPEVSIGLINNLLDNYADYERIFPGEYGLTIQCDLDEEFLDTYDWALLMTCNLEQSENFWIYKKE